MNLLIYVTVAANMTDFDKSSWKIFLIQLPILSRLMNNLMMMRRTKAVENG